MIAFHLGVPEFYDADAPALAAIDLELRQTVAIFPKRKLAARADFRAAAALAFDIARSGLISG